MCVDLSGWGHMKNGRKPLRPLVQYSVLFYCLCLSPQTKAYLIHVLNHAKKRLCDTDYATLKD